MRTPRGRGEQLDLLGQDQRTELHGKAFDEILVGEHRGPVRAPVGIVVELPQMHQLVDRHRDPPECLSGRGSASVGPKGLGSRIWIKIRATEATMKGVVFLGDRKLELRDFPDPTPGPRDVILEIKASGMCGSDLHNYRAPANPGGAVTGGIKREAGVIAGHEPCGVVAAVGAAVTEKEARVGQRVMDHHYDGCGTCKHCRAGWTQMCLAGTVVYGSGGHGGHARYMKVPVSTLVPLPDPLSFVTGAAISCGTGTAWGALKRINLQGGETIAIFGQGPVGLSATQLAVEMGARVIAIDVSAERRKLAQGFGAHEVIDGTAGDVVAAIRDLTHGEGAHKTLDAFSAPG